MGQITTSTDAMVTPSSISTDPIHSPALEPAITAPASEIPMSTPAAVAGSDSQTPEPPISLTVPNETSSTVMDPGSAHVPRQVERCSPTLTRTLSPIARRPPRNPGSVIGSDDETPPGSYQSSIDIEYDDAAEDSSDLEVVDDQVC